MFEMFSGSVCHSETFPWYWYSAVRGGGVAFAMDFNRQRSRKSDLSCGGWGDTKVCRFALSDGLVSLDRSLRFVEGSRKTEDWTLASGDVFLINPFMSGDQQL